MSIHSSHQENVRLSGHVVNVRYQSDESGWFAADIELDAGNLVRVTGTSAIALAPDFAISVTGKFVTNKYGQAFEAAEVEASPPRTALGIRRYLSGGTFTGIGTRTADAIVDHFGDQTLQILDHAPERLSEVQGLGKKKREALAQAWVEQAAMREIAIFALSQGITMKQIRKIIAAYGAQAASVIKADPYRLYREIEGIGFRTADAIARKLGVGFESPLRIQAGLRYTLEQATTAGHCCLPGAELLQACGDSLTYSDEGSSKRIPDELLRRSIKEALKQGDLVLDYLGDVPCVFLPWLHKAEDEIAKDLQRLMQSPPRDQPPPGLIDSIIQRAADSTGFILEPEQWDAVATALGAKVCVITGGPGTGKTTIQKVLLAAFQERGWTTLLCAPTGKAANRMIESTGFEAKTIHRLLEYKNGVFTRNRDTPLDCDVVCADEYSMPDVPLTASLLQALPDHARLVLIGDVDQIPSIGPGNVLADIINSSAVPVVRLTTVRRQAAQSAIIRAAHAIRQGIVPDLADFPSEDDISVVYIDDSTEAVPAIMDVLSAFVENDIARAEIQIITPTNRGPAGVHTINDAVADFMRDEPPATGENDGPSEAQHWPGNFSRFQPKDRTINTKNNYELEIFNGDIGTVIGITDVAAEEVARRTGSVPPKDQKALQVQFAQGLIPLLAEDLERLMLAWVISIHRSQGSEFNFLIVTLCMSHFVMLQRNLVYTAITRGKFNVVLVVQRRALEIAVANTSASRRHTRLKQILRSNTH